MPANAVKRGGSPFYLRCVTPAGAAPGEVDVTVGNATLAGGYRYKEPRLAPAPVVTSMTPIGALMGAADTLVT